MLSFVTVSRVDIYNTPLRNSHSTDCFDDEDIGDGGGKDLRTLLSKVKLFDCTLQLQSSVVVVEQ